MADVTTTCEPAKSKAADEASRGHAAHTKAADSQLGLRGKINRAIHITFMGAGSGFCPTLCRDVLMIPGGERGEFRLCHIDKDRLSMMRQVIDKLIKELGRERGWSVRASDDRRELLSGS